VKDCIRPIKLDKGTASYPKAKECQKMKVAGMELCRTEEDSSDSDFKVSSRERDKEEWEGEYMDKSDEEIEKDQEEVERNWGDSPSDSELISKPH